MGQNFSSFFNKDRIEVSSGLFSAATIVNSDFCIMVQTDGHPEGFFNFYDFESISYYLSMTLSGKKRDKNKRLIKNTKDSNEKIQIDNLHSNWSSLLSKVDEEILAVHKMNLHSTGFRKYLDMDEIGEPKLIFLPEFYNCKFRVKDAKKFRAANIAFNNIDYLICRKMSFDFTFDSAHQYFISELLNHLGNSSQKTDNDNFRKFINKKPMSDNLFSPIFDLENYYTIENIFKECQNWMCLFSDNGKTYRALNKTLMNLPPQVPEGIVCQLPKYHLHKPLTERLEFLLYFLSDEPYHQNIYRNSSSEQIRKAFKIYCEHLDQKITYSTMKIYDFLLFLNDYRCEYTGNIIDLTKNAIKWHAENYQRDFEDFNHFNYNGHLDEETVRPPIPLPKNDNIRFLSSAKEIIEEGKLMRHCVATYIDQAIKGESFLFHIDYNGESATAEIDKYGVLRQIKGVENKHNQACDYGIIVFSDWCKKFRDDINPFKYMKVDDMPF